MKSWPFLLATLMLLSTWGVIQSFSRVEPDMAKKSFCGISLNFGRSMGRKRVRVGGEHPQSSQTHGLYDASV